MLVRIKHATSWIGTELGNHNIRDVIMPPPSQLMVDFHGMGLGPTHPYDGTKIIVESHIIGMQLWLLNP